MESKFKILVVEDDVELMKLERIELERSGLQVHSAFDYLSSKQLLETEKFDCILLDLELGKDCGQDIFRFVRSANSLNQSTSILLVSGTLEFQVVKDFKTEIQGVLLKPFGFEQLVQKVLETIQNHSQKGSARTATS